MNKAAITKIFRSLRLMHLIDIIKYGVQKIKNASANNKFKKEHTEIKLPPDYMMFEAFQLNYDKYYNGGKNTANFIKTEIEPFIKLDSINILDWGCGPARVLRHLPSIINNNCNFYGTDYNHKAINWCFKNIKGIDFRYNEIKPPLNFEKDFFSAIYGISIFTHLSKESHYLWFNELIRVSKSGAVILLTTHGEIFKTIMTETEIIEFDKGDLVTRANVIEGHRVYTAFQPKSFIHKLVEGKCEILKHTEGTHESWGASQDLWIFKKI